MPVSRPASTERWPCPTVKIKDDPHFLFIITPPYSGSTALAQLLNSCHTSAFLQKRAEGQWLIPGMCEKGRWDRGKYIDWNSVRAVWHQRINLLRESDQNLDLIIEKSPPNTVRIDHLINAFPNSTLMAFNRNPYANCASILHRRHEQAAKSSADHIILVKSKAERWLFRSRWIRKWITEMDVVNFTYEEFCSDPAACISRLYEYIPSLRTVDVDATIKVKDYEKQKLANQNTRQIAGLNRQVIDAISEVLDSDIELVTFFGYSLM